MLEQAAGITIYKTRKKEAKNKLDATEQDLARIEDLLFEINNQLKTLESQAKKAEKFYEIKKEYKEVAVELAKAALEGFNISYRELTEQQEQELDKKTQLEAEIATEEAAIEQEKAESAEKEEALEMKRVDLVQLQEQHENTKEQIFETQQQLEVLRSELADENRKLDAKRNEYNLLKSLIDSMEGYPESIKFLHKNNDWNHNAPILSDIIYVKEDYRTAVENVLEPYLNYYVVNNLEEGNVYIGENDEAIRNSNGAVVLEKTGKYVKGKYTLTGGSVGLFEGKKIGRAKNLEKLAEEIQDQESVVSLLKADIQAKHNEVITFSDQLKEHAIKATEQEINQLNNQDEQDAIAETRELLAELNIQLQDTAEQMRNLEQDYQESEQAYHFASEAEQAIVDGVASLQEVEALLLELMRKKEEEELKLNEADQAYYNFRNALQEKESELRLKVKSKEMIDHLVTELKDKLNELKLQLAGMKERLHVEFKIELDEILDQPRTSDTPLEELQAASDRMRKRLDNMGEVNPTAIEAYTEMKKRYDFILEQKNDLVTAKESLLQTILEVEETANQLFLDTFNKVRENFQKVFKALFTEEDTADMLMVNPENLADTGIEIVAKPKGTGRK
eukprot:gene34278-biopygen2474